MPRAYLRAGGVACGRDSECGQPSAVPESARRTAARAGLKLEHPGQPQPQASGRGSGMAGQHLCDGHLAGAGPDCDRRPIRVMIDWCGLTSARAAARLQVGLGAIESGTVAGDSTAHRGAVTP